ncbi:MAG TPA: DNA polymerase ligase N-terminal domain-containing protein [Planctomycetota bacterium]|nr:DNA polymerase ligase N-terminal domain-containing protein [Planctomycetota bacterium]
MPRYVLLHHTGHPAKQDHFDLMLEYEGKLRTWVVDDVEVSNGRAVQSFDHRLAYVTHEGSVSGGRGEVRRVAGGEFGVIEWQERRIRIKMGDRIVTLTTDQAPGDGTAWAVTREAAP